MHQKNVLIYRNQILPWGEFSRAYPYYAFLRDKHSRDANIDLRILDFKDSNCYSYKKHIEPIDFYRNVVQPTFGINFFYLNSIKYGDTQILSTKYDRVYHLHVKNVMLYPQCRTFDWKLKESCKDENYKMIQQELSNTKNFLITANFDENKKACKRDIDKYGWGIKKYEFQKIYNTVMLIDKFCVENPEYRIILFSKKAHDWHLHLKSNFFDLRYFEKLNLSMSQAWHLAIDNCFTTVGCESSAGLWGSYQKDRKHIFFMFSKYTPDMPHYPYYHVSLPKFSFDEELTNMESLLS